MYHFIAETPRLAKLSPSFASREEAIEFGRQHWSRIQRAGTRRCLVADDAGHRDIVWLSPCDLPEGHYGRDGKRYYVSRPAEGKWAGWTFLKTGSDYHDRSTLAMVRPDGTIAKPHAVLTAICCDPLESAAEYGRITGRCSACGRKLENPESRARGMGPVCAERWGL